MPCVFLKRLELLLLLKSNCAVHKQSSPGADIDIRQLEIQGLEETLEALFKLYFASLSKRAGSSAAKMRARIRDGCLPC